MLTVILKILGIVGMALLILLCVILGLLCLVLFLPITYRVAADRKMAGDPPAADMHLQLKVNWLFGLLRVRYYYPEPAAFTVKLLFFKVFDSSSEKKADKKKSRKKSAKDTKRKGKAEQTDSVAQSSEDLTDAGGSDTQDEILQEETFAPKQPQATAQTAEQATEQTDGSAEQPKRAKSLREKIEDLKDKLVSIKRSMSGLPEKMQNARDNASYYKDLIFGDDTRELVSHLLLRLGRILKHIRPRKLKADILLGTGSPDTTGYILGVYCMLKPSLGKHVVLTPDFENAIAEGNVYAAGHITLCRLLWHGLRLLLDKHFRRLVRKVKNR